MTEAGAAGTPRVTVGLVCTIGIGAARGGREANEDNYLVCRDGRIAWREGDGQRVAEVASTTAVLVAVADGMGGHDDGELASAAAVQAMSPLYLRPVPADPEEALRAWMLEAHHRVRARVEVDGKVKMGTTLTMAWLLGERLYWSHVGDSRLYLFRAGKLSQLTRDQTRAEFARRDDRPEPPAPHNLSQSFIYGSRGLGDDRGVRIDRGVDTGQVTLEEGDRVLLCSDGLSGAVDDARIAETLAGIVDPDAAAAALADGAMAADSTDNITVMVLRVNRPAGTRAPDPDEWSGEDTTLVPV